MGYSNPTGMAAWHQTAYNPVAKVPFKAQFSCLKRDTHYNFRCPKCLGPPPQACRYDPESLTFQSSPFRASDKKRRNN